MTADTTAARMEALVRGMAREGYISSRTGDGVISPGMIWEAAAIVAELDAQDHSPDASNMVNVERSLDSGRGQTFSAEAEHFDTFQQRVQPWLLACFGEMIAGDREERNHRFLEEALELVQACGCTANEAHQLVDYTFGRPVGELHQEIGGVMVTLAALCLANDADMHAAGWVELDRIWGKVEAIRAKQAAKPKYSPLPQHAAEAEHFDPAHRHDYDGEIEHMLGSRDPAHLGENFGISAGMEAGDE